MTTSSEPAHVAPPEPSSDVLTAEARFARYLYGIALRAGNGDGSERARLARLRQTLGRLGVTPLAYREIGGALPQRQEGQSQNEYEQVLDAYLLVATLFALHVAKSEQPWRVQTGASLGASCRRLKGGAGSMDARFAALLDARSEDLPYRLRQVVALLAAHDVGVRYDVLLRDLLAWDVPSRKVQRKWAADYWAPAARYKTS